MTVVLNHVLVKHLPSKLIFNNKMPIVEDYFSSAFKFEVPFIDILFEKIKVKHKVTN